MRHGKWFTHESRKFVILRGKTGSTAGMAPGRAREGYSPPSEHASSPSEGEKRFFGDFWHL